MIGREERQEEILAAYLDDLLADRVPALPNDVHEAFTDEELASQIAALRLLKGALRPSHTRPGFGDGLLTELRRQVREQASQRSTQPQLGKIIEFARERRHLRRGEVGRQIGGVAARRIEELERSAIDPLSLPAETYVGLCRLLGIPRADLAISLGMAARQWTAKLGQQRRIDSACAIPAGLETGVSKNESEQAIAAFERERQALLQRYLRAILVADSRRDAE